MEFCGRKTTFALPKRQAGTLTCVATANYFTAAFFPVANVDVNHRYTPSKMDPVFFPRLTKISPSFQAEAMKQIEAMGGKISPKKN